MPQVVEDGREQVGELRNPNRDSGVLDSPVPGASSRMMRRSLELLHERRPHVGVVAETGHQQQRLALARSTVTWMR